MIKKACTMPTLSIVAPKAFQGGRLFDLSNAALNRDNVLYPYHLLREKMKERGWSCVTSDQCGEDCDATFYLEMPNTLPQGKGIATSYLWVGESELIIPKNWDMQAHKHFAKLFTWHDGFVDGKRYIKLNFAQKFESHVPTDISAKTGFCTLIAGNKQVRHPLELYSERVRAIRWFEQHAPEGFTFYGMGWNQRNFSGKLHTLNRLNRIGWLRRLLAPTFTSYGGPVSHKLETLSRYRFAICYENGRDIPGYITEKIFDCLQAGCVPVYWGAPNITDYVPANCFVDARKFLVKTETNDSPTLDYASLNQTLRGMGDDVYGKYLENIAEYIQKTAMNGLWSAEYFAETLAREIAGDTDSKPVRAKT